MDEWKRGCNPWATFSNKLPSQGGNLQIPWVEGDLIHFSQLSWGERNLTKIHLATFLAKLLGEEGGLATSSRKRKFLQAISLTKLHKQQEAPVKFMRKHPCLGAIWLGFPSLARKVTQWMNVVCVNLFYNLSFMLYNIFSTSHSFLTFHP